MMTTAVIFEAIMLICFGAAWPLSIYKSYKSRANHGKSVFFLYVILLGYFAGIIYQFMVNASDYFVIILFITNSLMVTIDILLFYRNEIIMSRAKRETFK
jgi:hypothetical protein